jgi:D-glycero-D-manno-heptose 1,7-bisphosphate phosphatase
MSAAVPALFLDRDGVINVDIGYLHRAEDCEFVPGIFEVVRRARRAGYDVFVVTNQAGIARGYYSEETFDSFTRWMLDQFEAEGAPITKVYYCPHHPSAGQGEYLRECECRKPAPGMLLQAAREYPVDLTRSVLIGDSATDIDAARTAGVPTRILIGDAKTPGVAGDFIAVTSLVEAMEALHWN